MDINKTVKDGVMTVTVNGEINTLTTPTVAKYVENLNGIKKLIFDMESVPYISSAGLRLLFFCLKTLKESGGELLIVNCEEFVAEIFESVGYDRIMNVKTKTVSEK